MSASRPSLQGSRPTSSTNLNRNENVAGSPRATASGWAASFLVRDRDQPEDAPPTARLRLLLVDPAARGMGLGLALVREVTAYARNAGYRKIVLWTNSVLDSARRIYEQEGYQLIREKPYTAFGKDLVSQDWQLDLL